MSGEKGTEYNQQVAAAAGAPPGQGPTLPGPRGPPPRGYGPPPGHAPPQQQQQQLHFAQPHYIPPSPYAASPAPRPRPPPPRGFNARPQQQRPVNMAYGMPQQPPVVVYHHPPQPVVIQQPVVYHHHQQPVYQPQPVVVTPPPPQPLGQWTTGLFDCGEDPSNCVITFFLPCITFGQIAEVVDQGTTSCLLAGSIWTTVLLCFGCPCFVSCLWRTKLRAKYNLPQDEVGDLCLHFWCEACALCQEYRELNNRGLNPAMGWEHHRQQMYAQMGPPNPVYMQR